MDEKITVSLTKDEVFKIAVALWRIRNDKTDFKGDPELVELENKFANIIAKKF